MAGPRRPCLSLAGAEGGARPGPGCRALQGSLSLWLRLAGVKHTALPDRKLGGPGFLYAVSFMYKLVMPSAHVVTSVVGPAAVAPGSSLLLHGRPAAAGAWSPGQDPCGGPADTSSRLPRFRQRRLDKARQRREAEAADRREQELLQGQRLFGTGRAGRAGAGGQPWQQACLHCLQTRCSLVRWSYSPPS